MLNLPCRLGLEQPPIVRVGGDVGSQGGGEGLTKQHVAILGALALVDPDLTGFDINFGNSDVAEFTYPHRREEQEPEHQGVLNFLSTIHDLIEPAELVSGQDTGSFATLLLGSQVTEPSAPSCLYTASPSYSEPLLLDQSGDLGDELSLG